HVLVPILSLEEQSALLTGSTALAEAFASVGAPLRELLAIPFNVRLLAAVLEDGVPVSEMPKLRTQIDLVDRYWMCRVIGHDQLGFDREGVLRKACETMVNARLLVAAVHDFLAVGASARLSELLSNGILVPGTTNVTALDRSFVRFAHHVLFDHAAERLLLRSTAPATTAARLRDVDSMLMIRPSLTLHLQHLWDQEPDRRRFWRAVEAIIADTQVPEIAKTAGPAMAAAQAKTRADIEDLIRLLKDRDQDRAAHGRVALCHLIGELQLGRSTGCVVGPRAGPWVELLEAISEDIDPEMAFRMYQLFMLVADRTNEVTDVQRRLACTASLRLLDYHVDRGAEEAGRLGDAIRFACTFLPLDIERATRTLRRCLEPALLNACTVEVVRGFVDSMSSLGQNAQELAADVCRTAFARNETSTRPRPMGTSRILPLISNHRQDYELCLHELGSGLPEFLRQAPIDATRAVIDIIEQHCRKNHHAKRQVSVRVGAHEIVLLYDYSSMWDDRQFRDPPETLLPVLEAFLIGIGRDAGDSERLRNCVLELFFERASTGALWCAPRPLVRAR
ncbi:MAG: hypothetical protein HY815_16080, partial [Candidatus Riflebacteria bacterium]|nr:hypothetical protein [Candidatus Riflebacteria bacterium]